MLSIKKSRVLSRVRVESPGLSHESESSQPEKSESSTTLVYTYIFTKSLQETRRRFLPNFNLNHRQLKVAPGCKSVQKWVKNFRNLGTMDKRKSPGQHRTARPPPSSKLPPPSSRARKDPFGIGHRRIGRSTLRGIMKEKHLLM